MDLSQLKQLVCTVALLTLVGCASAPKSLDSVKSPSAELASVVGSAAPGAQVSLPANNSLGLNTVVVDQTYYAASGRQCRRMRQVDGTPIQRVACKSADGVWRFARDLRPVSSSRAFGAATNKTATLSSGALDTGSANANTQQALIPSAGSEILLIEDGSVSDVPSSGTVEPVVIGAAQSEFLVKDGELLPNMLADEPTDQDTMTIDTVQRELNANETLWSFAKRTTGNALNWQAIAEHNGISDAKTLAPGALLSIPAELVGQGG